MRFNKALAVLAVMLAASLWGAPVFAEATPNTSDDKKSTDSKQESDKKSKEEKSQKEVIVTVTEGDSLSSIAEANGTTWTRLFDANEAIANPDAINPGDKIRIPAAEE